MKNRQVLFFVLYVFCHSVYGQPTDRADIYYLAVGSAHFAQASNGRWNLTTIEAAYRGAQRVAELLDRHGAKFGVLLTSKTKQTPKEPELASASVDFPIMISKSDIIDQLSSVISRAEEDNSRNILLIVYVSSHGFAKGSAKAHYTVPGNVVFTNDPLKLPRRMIWNKLLYVGEIVRALESSGKPYMLLLDTCYENSQNWQKKVYSREKEFFIHGPEEWDKLIISERVREQYQDTYPVVFAVDAGEVAFTVPDPRDNSSTETLSPLARRMTILLDRAKFDGVSLHASDLIHGLTDKSFDKEITTPGVTFSKRVKTLKQYSLTHNAINIDRKNVLGSSLKPVYCCSGEDFRLK